MKDLPCLKTLLILPFLAPGSMVAQTLALVPSESSVQWKATKVTGAHDGHVAIQQGEVVMNDGVLAQADVTMDMTTITCDDITSEGSNDKLVRHLKSEDFFDVENHGQATFRTRSVEKIAGRANAYRVTGELTIKGITKPNTFEVSAVRAAGAMRVTGSLVFDRTDYEIQYRSGSFFEGLGDRMIHDPVTLELAIVAR